MKWIYILKCEDDYFYVGLTSRLYRRFWEHQDGVGGANTSTYIPEEIVAIYKADTICKFIDYNEHVNDILNKNECTPYKYCKLKYFNDETDYLTEFELCAENNIAECLMIHKKDEWNKIRGGKYTRFDVEYKFPNNNYIRELPLCKCGLPCDIRKNEDQNFLYFRCAKKNMWDGFIEEFGIDDKPCNFFLKYIKDEPLKNEENKKFQERCHVLKQLYQKSPWLVYVEPHTQNIQCIGGCNKTDGSSKLKYRDQILNICYDCFISKNEELSKKYNSDDLKKCLI